MDGRERQGDKRKAPTHAGASVSARRTHALQTQIWRRVVGGSSASREKRSSGPQRRRRAAVSPIACQAQLSAAVMATTAGPSEACLLIPVTCASTHMRTRRCLRCNSPPSRSHSVVHLRARRVDAKPCSALSRLIYRGAKFPCGECTQALLD